MDKPVSQMTPNEHTRHMQEGRILDQIERQQRWQPVGYPGSQQPSTGSATPQGSKQQYFTPGGFREAREGVLAAIFAPIMYAIYIAAVQRGHSYKDSLLFATLMIMRWKVWGFTVLYWFVSGACIWFWRGAEAAQGDPATGYTTGKDVSFQTGLLLLHVLLLVPAVLVTYCQAIDATVLKQRLLYRVLHPAYVVLGRIPWFVLTTLVLLPLLLIIQYRW